MSRRLCKKEKEMFIEEVKQLMLEGKPYQEIAFAIGKSQDFVMKVAANLVIELSNAGYRGPAYEVVLAGIPAKNLPFFLLGDAEYLKVEKHGNGILITPFIVESKHEPQI